MYNSYEVNFNQIHIKWRKRNWISPVNGPSLNLKLKMADKIRSVHFWRFVAVYLWKCITCIYCMYLPMRQNSQYWKKKRRTPVNTPLQNEWRNTGCLGWRNHPRRTVFLHSFCSGVIIASYLLYIVSILTCTNVETLMYFYDSCFLPVQMLELWWRRKPKALRLSCFCTVNDLVLLYTYFNHFWIPLQDPVLPGIFLFDVCLISPYR